MKLLRFLHIFLFFIGVTLFPTILSAQNSEDNLNTVLYVKLKSDQNEVLGPWSRSYLSDKDEPAKMLKPKFYMHLIQRRVRNLSTEHFFPRPYPDILEIELQPGSSVENAIKKLKEHPLVEYVEIEEYVNDLYTPNDTRSGEQFSIPLHNLTEAWDISRGDENVVIGIHDSGFNTSHEDLMGNLYVNEAEANGFDGVDDDNNGYIDDIHGWNFKRNSNDLTGTAHGIYVSGSASATGDNNLGVIGSGFNCTYLPVVRSRLSSLVYTCEQNNVKIVNMSWGSRGSNQISYQEVINYYSETPEYDILFIAAAGNDPHGNVPSDYYPASYENVLSVTGVNQNRENTGRTRGYLIDVAAADGSLSTHNSGYANQFGTSYASPTVAGIAGLIRSEFPDLKAYQVAELIRYTSDTTFYDVAANNGLKYLQGYGVVDAHRALTGKDNIHVARASNIRYNKLNSSDIFLAAGDSMEINMDIQNIFNGNSNLKVKLTPYDPNITAVSNEVTIGQILESQITNNPNPFVFKLGLLTNLHENHYFKIEFYDEANNYYDWQNIEINLTLQQYISLNNINGYFRPDGTLGTAHGLNFGSHPMTKSTGLMVVANNKVVDVAYTDSDNNIRSSDFRGTNTIQQVTTSSTDPVYPYSEYLFQYEDGNATDPIGLNITQRLFGKFETNRDRAIFTEYQITNNGTGDLDSLAIGLFTDWNFSYQGNDLPFQEDSSRCYYDPVTQTVYAFHSNNFLNGAIRLLNRNETVHLQNMDIMRPINSEIDISNDYTDAEKITTLSNGIGTEVLGYSTIGGTNIATALGTALADVKLNETVHVGFLFVVGESIDVIRTQLDSAQKASEYWLKGPSPSIAHQVANEGEMVNIRTTTFDSLALYKLEGNTKVLKGRGRLFQVLIDSIDYYYVQSQGRFVYDGDLVQLTGDAIPYLSATTPMNVCRNTKVIVSPNGCSTFNFYDNPLMISPVYTGSSLILEDLERDTTFYVTCAVNNSIDNSLRIDVLVKNSINNFLLSENSSYVGGAVTATLAQTDDAVSWQWYHNGELLNANDQASVDINFSRQGTHEIRLSATNEAGCTYFVTKEIEVFLDNPNSSVVSLLENSILYPNPIKNGWVNITVPSSIGQITFDLLQVDGSLIQAHVPYVMDGSKYTVYLPQHLSSKTYLLRGQANGGSYTWKISID
ncbi:S8 family serine peptidase [Flammeovirga sp. MY04]|uniref:S8 family serine peptidase n=1 Tax=Flammeovirga sp. MY04 TaxID=1191459 RepID=UPI00080622F1|nr:S8 family serine peptidase [Flammeovirga sp. MY04]ANQ51302.1 S8 family serine peptidase [Flammeovirga sp. MY04]